jgi:hypothetical protein
MTSTPRSNTTDSPSDILDRLEDLDRARVEQERAARRKRLDR